MADDFTAIFKYNEASGATAVNVVSFATFGADIDNSVMDDIVGKWFGMFWADVANANWSYEGGTRCVFPAINPTGEFFATNDADVGLDGGQAGPVQCCYLLSTSAGLGRRRRGRIYVPGISEERCQGSAITGAFLGAITLAFSDFLADIASNHDVLVGVRSELDGVVRPIQSFAAVGNVMTQRRRVERLTYG